MMAFYITTSSAFIDLMLLDGVVVPYVPKINWVNIPKRLTVTNLLLMRRFGTVPQCLKIKDLALAPEVSGDLFSYSNVLKDPFYINNTSAFTKIIEDYTKDSNVIIVTKAMNESNLALKIAYILTYLDSVFFYDDAVKLVGFSEVQLDAMSVLPEGTVCNTAELINIYKEL